MFIVLDGVDGSGKSTQIDLLAGHLLQAGRKVLVVRDPGTTPVGRKVREMLLDPGVSMEPMTQMLLFSGVRSETACMIQQKLGEQEVDVVLADRWVLSTHVYQGQVQYIDNRLIQMIYDASNYNLEPWLTLVLDVPIATAIRRLQGKYQDRFEGKPNKFHEDLRTGYLNYALAFPSKTVVVDADVSPGRLLARIYSLCRDRISHFPVLQIALDAE